MTEQTTKNEPVPQETKGVSLVIPPRCTDTPPMISYGTLESRVVGLLGKGLGVKRMAKVLGVPPSNITRAIASLRRKGLKIGLGGECPNLGETLKSFSSPQEMKGVSVASWGTINHDTHDLYIPKLPLEQKENFVFSSRAHNIKLKFPVTSGKIKDFTGWKEIRLRYNSQWHKTKDQIHYIWTTKSLLVEFPAVSVRDANEYMEVIRRVGEELVKEFQAEYNVRLQVPSFSQQVVSQHHALVNDPFAKWLRSKNITYSDGLFDVDSSTGRDELEFTDKENAVADWTRYNDFIKDVITAPEQVRLSDVMDRMQKIEANLERATETLANVVRSQEASVKMLELLLQGSLKQTPQQPQPEPKGSLYYVG